jgi:hypothetical protein
MTIVLFVYETKYLFFMFSLKKRVDQGFIYNSTIC